MRRETPRGGLFGADTLTKLATLLWVDSEHRCRNGLSDCLGDSYLYVHNALFTRLRDLSLALEYRYSSEPSRLWRDYSSAPFFLLQDILNTHTIPYVDNTQTLKRVLELNPSFGLPARALLAQVKKNYLLHESAHCVAHALLPKVVAVPQSKASEAFVLRALICESFANAIERIAGASATSATQLLFFYMNSYVTYTEDDKRSIEAGLYLFGIEKLFRLGFLTYLFVNSHSYCVDQCMVDYLIEAVFLQQRLPIPDKYLAENLVRNVFTLRAEFRAETSAMFFRLFDCELDFLKLNEARFTPEALKDLGVLDQLDCLVSEVFKKWPLSTPSSPIAQTVAQGNTGAPL